MTIRNYTQKRKKQLFLVGGITLLSCFSALFFMTVFSDIPISHLPQLLIRFFQNENLSPQEKIILYMRMPTVLMTILAGISLSISGGVMQSITHNDLVSPFTLGISAAAAFGASLCIVFGGSVLHSTGGLILGAFTASCLCISLVYGLSFKTGSAASTLVLIGIAMNYLFSAGSAAIFWLKNTNWVKSFNGHSVLLTRPTGIPLPAPLSSALSQSSFITYFPSHWMPWPLMTMKPSSALELIRQEYVYQQVWFPFC